MRCTLYGRAPARTTQYIANAPATSSNGAATQAAVFHETERCRLRAGSTAEAVRSPGTGSDGCESSVADVSTAAMKRYPRRPIVSTKRGSPAVSLRARRTLAITVFRL